MGSSIHSTAIVDPDAKLGADVSIGAYSIVGPKVEIGDGCLIGPHVVVEGITTIGAQCEIFQFASIGAKPQDLKYHGEPSTLVIGARNKVREFVTLQPGTESGGMTTTIGDNNLFMANSHVGHDCIIGNNNVFANSAGLAGHVTVFDNVILGGLVGIHQYVRIGNNSFLSAGSMVGKDIPPYCFAQGDRCYLRGLNLIGLQRAGYSAEDVSAIKKAYRHLFGSVGNIGKKLETLPDELKTVDPVAVMLKFLEGSERGVTPPARSGSSSE